MSQIWRIYPCKIWFGRFALCERFDISQLCGAGALSADAGAGVGQAVPGMDCLKVSTVPL